MHTIKLKSVKMRPGGPHVSVRKGLDGLRNASSLRLSELISNIGSAAKVEIKDLDEASRSKRLREAAAHAAQRSINPQSSPALRVAARIELNCVALRSRLAQANAHFATCSAQFWTRNAAIAIKKMSSNAVSSSHHAHIFQ